MTELSEHDISLTFNFAEYLNGKVNHLLLSKSISIPTMSMSLFLFAVW